MITAIFILTVLGVVMGTLLGIASKYLAVEGNPLEAEIEELLPGSQCGQCGYPGLQPGRRRGGEWRGACHRGGNLH